MGPWGHENTIRKEYDVMKKPKKKTKTEMANDVGATLAPVVQLSLPNGVVPIVLLHVSIATFRGVF